MLKHFHLLAGLAAAFFTTPAIALCSGRTIEQEYTAADVVVRAHLVAETTSWNDEPDVSYRRRWGESANTLVYRLSISEVFKGKPGTGIDLFEERNSGAFYLDVDRDYLLFLNYYPRAAETPDLARGATYVRYACGHSKKWIEVAAAEKAALQRLVQGDAR